MVGREHVDDEMGSCREELTEHDGQMNDEEDQIHEVAFPRDD
jgi:hypothetical protein